MNILHIDSSALGGHSVSRQLSLAVVETLTRANPGAGLVYRDVAAHPLSHWAPVADAADPAARSGSAVLDEFLAADVVVIGAPMYNFSIPSTLKAWIDRVMVAGTTFRYSANGPEGLAGGKRVVIVSSRGGVYSEGPMQPLDFQEEYLRKVFGFLGITDIEVVRAEGVNLSPESRQRAIARALEGIHMDVRVAA